MRPWYPSWVVSKRRCAHPRPWGRTGVCTASANWSVDREYGLGRRCSDLCVVWSYPSGVQRGVIGLKIRYHSLEQTLAAGLEQTWRYADATGAEEAHLVIFDRRPKVAWSKKIWQRSEQYAGMAISVWGM